MQYNTIKHFANFALPYTFVLTAIFSVTEYANPSLPILYFLNNTTLIWTISIFILAILFFSKEYFFDDINKKNISALTYYLLWTFVCIIRGMFVAEGYWEWKGLITNIMGLLLPLVAYSSTNKVVVQTMILYYVKYALPLFLILVFLIRRDAFGSYLMPISFLLLFLPALSKRKKNLLLLIVVVVIVADLTSRSNVIKFGVPILLLSIYYMRDKITSKFLESVRLVLIIAPLLFFTLAVTSVFNVFKMNEYLGEQKVMGTDNEGKRVEQDMAVDTRTFIYEEVLKSAMKNDYWIFGRTPARGNDSAAFGGATFELTKRYERLANEVGVANVFTWMGVVGVILYFFIFFRASFLAVNRSRNIYAKMLGIYVAFRWLYSWVEDVNNFTLNYFMLWIMIGLCFSYSFRMMSDYEVTIWIRGVFDQRYLNFDKYLNKEENEK